MNIIIIAMSSTGYWGKGTSIQEALAELECKTTSQRIMILGYVRADRSFKDSPLERDEINVDEYGGIHYPGDCIGFELGRMRGTPARMIVKEAKKIKAGGCEFQGEKEVALTDGKGI